MHTQPISHSWYVTPKEAIAIQEALRQRVKLRPLRNKPKIVTGLDTAADRNKGCVFGAAVSMRLPGLEVVEYFVRALPATFPYIPGMLTFREGPVLIEAVRELRVRPDVLLCDGQGIAHIRRLGLASHIGVLLDMPSVGCAKKRLVGEHGPIRIHRGATSDLVLDGRTVGCVVRTRTGVKPVFVSVGHLLSLPDAVAIVLDCTTGYRIPEPIRQAHLLARRAARGELASLHSGRKEAITWRAHGDSRL